MIIIVKRGDEVSPMCFPQQKNNKTCACSGNNAPETERFCDCHEMRKSFDERLRALEKKFE
jgi:hypothetical protein